ncbi:MAG: hypothetical protein ACTHK7_18005 [Aureliella sp.]
MMLGNDLWKALVIAALACATASAADNGFQVDESPEVITIHGDALDAAIRKKGYVSGVMAGSLLDKKTGARDLGFGLDIVDWIMEPGSDEAYRDQLEGDLAYQFNNPYHGKTPKRSIEGPQICTQAKELSPKVIEGPDFVAVEQSWQYKIAAPGKATGSTWQQRIVFPKGKRYFISSDQIHSKNSSPAMFFRIDMPGHIKHSGGDTFSEVYLSYVGRIPAKEFQSNFAPDEKFNYRRDRDGVPERMIRAYHVRDPKSGKEGPWLAGMTLNPADTSEAWCHERGYVCMIEEIGERPIQAGQSFGAAFIVGWFDSIEEMHAVYDAHKGASRLEVDSNGWRLR